MMKLKVKAQFKDKYTNDKYIIGEEIEVNTERGKELLATSLVELLEEQKVERPRKKEVKKDE